ncbi:MAG: hypothetical protein DMF06_00365 [Verrucomicrobia bacterium]|nr:MAG: hypothetical protein DMF06_00365 [Verrucomicrobiota bacterium]
MSERSFFTDLKQRKLVQWAVAYVAAAFALLQGIDIVAQRFGWPEQTMRLVIIALSIGLFITLVLAWYHGERGAQRVSGTELLILALLLAVGGGFLWHFASGTRELAAKVVPEEKTTTTGSPIPAKSIAVLPFENLSDDKGAAYFADGIQDEILTKLAGIADLKVISRTSTAKYKSKPEDLKTVSQQLGVATVLEGSVQKAADKVRVIVQLIDARTDSHIWAKTYDREIKDVFAVESEVAQEIADSLQAKLSPAEANTLGVVPTKNTAAYDVFLKGEYEFKLATSSLRPESFDQAVSWYQQAISQDPDFALAIARLVEARMQRHWFVESFTEAELAEVRQLAERALTLAPDLAEAHVARGIFYYYGYRAYEQALAAFERAMQLQPNNAQALEYSGYVHRRQGQWQKCLDELSKALERDPRNAGVAGNLGQTYGLLRMWKDGERVARHAISLDPHEVIGMRALLLIVLNGSGNVAEAKRALATFPPENKIVIPSISGGVPHVTGERAYTFVIAHDFEAALNVWSGAGNPIDQRRRLAARAAIFFLAGNLDAARTEGEAARPLVEERLRERPDELVALRELCWADLAAGRKEDARKVARHVVELLSPEKDTLVGTANLVGLAEIEAQVNLGSDAVEILRRLLSVPAGETVSIARLKIDPVWDPIRNDPGFQQLLTMKEHVGP